MENNGRPYSSGKNALFSDRKLVSKEIAKQLKISQASQQFHSWQWRERTEMRREQVQHQVIGHVTIGNDDKRGKTKNGLPLQHSMSSLKLVTTNPVFSATLFRVILSTP